MEPMTIKEFLFNATIVLLVIAFFYWLVNFLAKPTKRVRDYERQQSLIEQMSFENRWRYQPMLSPFERRHMTEEELKRRHEKNRMKRKPAVFNLDHVLRIDPDAFRIGDLMLKDGEWYEHNGKEWVMKHKYI